MKILVFFSSLFKGLILLLKPHYLFGFIIKPLQFIINTLLLSRWKSNLIKDSQALDDFYSYKRDYNKRYLLYEHLLKTHKLDEDEITYMEFGVASGSSFNWWLKIFLFKVPGFSVLIHLKDYQKIGVHLIKDPWHTIFLIFPIIELNLLKDFFRIH